MSIKTFLHSLVYFFVIVFVVNTLVVYLWEGAFDFKKAVIMGITVGIAIAFSEARKKK
jgi:hypothetical protein